MDPTVVTIKSQPGIKRDGTMLEGDNYVDGEWCRFQRGLPRKIGGFKAVNKYLKERSRLLHEYTQNQLTYIHSGSANYLERLYIDGSLNTSIITDRTPASGFTGNDANMWQFDAMFQSGASNKLIAQVAPNLNCICSADPGAIFIGDLLGTAKLTPVSLPSGGTANGGIVVLHPYLLFFGSDGYVGWSVAGNPSNLSGAGSGAANVASQKIVRGMPLRGGPGNSPSGLLWTADALVRATFSGGSTVFQFDTLSTQSSILGQNTVIEYDGVFYWIASDRFLMFNGVVREVPNDMNVNWFFDNLNYAYRQKVFAMKVPRYGEIWWCFPKGSSTECNHAIIYNTRENTWYDTPLPNGGRSAGLFPAIFRRPLMTGVTGAGSDFRLYVHETGVDEIDGQIYQPIRSYFETAEISFPTMAGQNKSTQVVLVEPDFVQSGDMQVAVHGRANARAPEVQSEPMVFPADPQTPQEQVVMFKEQRRQMRFRFESNTLGGDYQMGTVLAHVRPGDGTVLG